MKEKLLEKVLRCPRLPSLPTIALEVIELCRQQDINIKHIATTISNDPALSSKILKTVNSSFYGLSQSVSTISHALVILGLNSVKTLALGFTLIDTFKTHADDGFDMVQFFQRCLYSAVGARAIATAAGVNESEEAFLGGLLQDLGMMAMLQTLGPQYQELLKEVGNDHRELWKLERKQLGLDHAEAGAALGEKWKLPKLLIAPIKYHELPDKAPDDLGPMVRCVAIGSRAADVYLTNDPKMLEPYFEGLEQWFDIDSTEGEQLLQRIGDATKEMAALFEIPTADVPNVEDILAEANETLLQLSLQSAQSANQLEAKNRQLEEQMVRDSLTGAFNRGKFNEFIKRQFDAAAENGTDLGVIFLDADRFKSVNDTHGHQAGDKVLISLAQTLMDNTPDGCLVARYGGEEFAVILPGYDRKAAARVAESLRLKVEQQPIDCEDDLILNITVSMGVASFDGKRFFRRPEQLIEAADKAVYAAKSAGRNCVRVFAPRVPAAA
jgi:two-component system cell cycle response regulator